MLYKVRLRVLGWLKLCASVSSKTESLEHGNSHLRGILFNFLKKTEVSVCHVCTGAGGHRDCQILLSWSYWQL